jgi:plasmid stabilization system protein ParE
VKFQVELRPAAVADLRKTFEWYEERLPGLGEDFLAAVRAKLDQIESNPLQFPVVRGATRRAIVRRFPYGIFFVPGSRRIGVLAVMHHSQAPQRWQAR